MDYVLIAATSLRPDPDDTSPEVARLKIGDAVSSLREVKPWMKVAFAGDKGKQVLGWVHSDALKEDSGHEIQLFDEPAGKPSVISGSIVSVRLQLPPWQKVDIRLADGSVVSGWIDSASSGASEERASADDQAIDTTYSELVLGPNETYRPHLLTAEKRTDIAAAALAALINAEAAKLPNGEWDRNSTASTSSAAGLTQFLAATWLGEATKKLTYLNEHARIAGCIAPGNRIVPGMEETLLSLRFDPELSIIAAAEYGASNLKALVDSGLVNEEIGDDEKAAFIYLAHHEGLGGAQAFLKGTKAYTFSDLAKQVGQSKAQAYVDAAAGNSTKAYRNWLNDYLAKNIQPSKFRKSAASGPVSGGEGTRALSQYNGPPVLVAELSGNEALAKAVQWRLNELGYLDPPADGMFGPVSSWALSEFCDLNGVSLQDGFNVEIAQRLAAPTAFLPDVAASGAWFDKVIRYMRSRGYFISQHPDCKNIVYLEGVNPDGTLNDDAPNKFNDLRVVFSLDAGGRLDFQASTWDGTTEPGRYWTVQPMNRKGAARIAFNQYKAWVVGTHHANSPSAHEALVQVEPITVCRDLNMDFRRTGDEVDTGLFAINQHWGYDAPKDDLGRTSAGCLVGRTKEGHRKFMSMIKSDPRYVANHSYRFMTAVMPGDEVFK
ncbi:peptidoglycan-binding domain-containing protein [Rhizobium sp. S152]|uniref:peptidoglycan-binding domain-containing protein n=1 Tax=Rhizobium sp. S152 TaxID=3055038 RepID=UPI0025AA2C46|nr:peptidoglycan-binding domain-containing protein [Rhizobium sp. S152]MDM9629070.1 peptidoglycan-binding domain-containing protein [Rhizobium sp. S152]